MLVLARKQGEGITIGSEIQVTVIDVKGGTVRIGIEAPQDKKIYRLEVYERIKESNKEAVQWDLNILDAVSANIKTGKGNS